ncbi:MAG: hypothetical protein LBR53_08605 [Deltaproteobacteria bacterium]|jgi:hypothetical protein|nr:hypothetical protein [Deltaproteobacteria bacterium]
MDDVLKIVEGEPALEKAADIFKNFSVDDIDKAFELGIQAGRELAEERGIRKGDGGRRIGVVKITRADDFEREAIAKIRVLA